MKNRNNYQLLGFISELGLILIIVIIGLIVSGKAKVVRADERCGDGYACWESNGGTATVYATCKSYDGGSYCGGIGGPQYCSCDGSADCTCTLTGTSCSGVPTYEATDCYCADFITACTTQSDCVYGDCGDGGCLSGKWDCGSPSGTSTIGCCYGDGVVPGVSPPPPAPSPPPSGDDDVTVDIVADGSDGPITVGGPYTIGWSSVNASECTLNSLPSNTSGSALYTNGPGSYSYTYICTNATSSDTDIVDVIVDCGILTADVKANGSDTNITTFDPYTISWTSTNADDCTLNGSAVALNDSQVEPATTNGDYPYTLDCTNFCSDTSSDLVTVTVDLCGNGTCAGFENCSLCSADCGACPTAWWQVFGGNLFSSIASGDAIFSDISDSSTCIEPGCVPGLSVQDRAGTTYSDGFPITGGGAINNNGQMITYRDPDVYVIGTTTTRLYENYSYFYSKFSLGSSPFDDYSASDADALEPASSKDYYFHSGNMTIQSPWDVTNGESYVVFVDGNLTIEDPLVVGELIKVAEGGFLAFIVSGDINIADSVGHGVLTNSAGNIEGIFVADGIINIASNGTDDKKFVGEGTFIGWTNVALSRAYDELTSNNDLYPAETFVYRPDLVKNTPEKMKRAQMLWQETN